MRVTDDGVGIRGDPGQGNGLVNMTERARSVGGRLTIEAPPDGGFTVLARIPTQESNA